MSDLTVGISQDEFERFMDDLAKGVKYFREKIKDWASVLARMSREQVKQVKAQVNGLLTRNQVDLLVEVGRGALAQFWVDKDVPARIFRGMPTQATKALNDPTSPVEVATSRGVVMKQVKDLNPLEAKQVIAQGKGLLSAREQQGRMLKPTPRQSKTDAAAEKAFVFDGMNRTSSGHVLVYGRDSGDPAGSRSIAVRLTGKDLRYIRGS